MIGSLIFFMFGSIVGSFLNVCIHRMPLGESVVWPGSHCPKCKKRIPAYDNIPYISYLLLGGKCRFCKQKISLRYPIVELLTAALFVILFNKYGISYDLFFYMVLFAALVAATFIDIGHRIIPDEISIGGIILGFILSTIKGVNLKPLAFAPAHMFDSLLGIIAGGSVIYLTGKAFDLVYFKLLKHPPIQGETESMGGGDVKLLAMIGAFLGWQKALVVFLLAPFFGVIVGVWSLIFKKDHTIPYGPFLSLAAILSALWLGQIAGFYTSSMDKILNLIFP